MHLSVGCGGGGHGRGTGGQGGGNAVKSGAERDSGEKEEARGQ